MPQLPLKPVIPQPGRPLYQTVKEAVREAIAAGTFRPGEQMPSTKELSEQLAVSLVTAHRALQELVASGILYRAQGKGTFVHDRYLERENNLSDWQIGLVLHRRASLADFYHSQILEGVRQSAQELGMDLLLLRMGEDVRNQCKGYLYISPEPDALERCAARGTRRQPIVAVGRSARVRGVCCVDVDTLDLARQAIGHLAEMGHTRIGYVGGGEAAGSGRECWSAVMQACAERGIEPGEQHVIRGGGWRLDEGEQKALLRVLGGARRPTAVVAAGYHFALDAYSAAAALGLEIPGELSVVGMDDPASAGHLAPPLTALRRPLIDVGRAAVSAIHEALAGGREVEDRVLRAELVVRRSSGMAGEKKAPAAGTESAECGILEA